MKVNMAEMYVDDEIRSAVIEVLDSGRYIKGPQGKGLEREFADYCGAKHGVSCNSGTSALYMAMEAIGVGPGDEVIVPSHSFIATATPIIHLGGRPVFADVDPATATIDPEEVKALITDRTKAIIPVHLYGQPADMDPLMEIAEEEGIYVVEDACQAHGAEYGGRMIGSIGHIACFSFFPSKNMTVAGDGGIAVTSDPDLAEHMGMFRDQGRKEKYTHELVGFNFRLSEILAAIGRAQLRHLSDWVDGRRRVAAMYNELLGDVVETPKEADGRKHVYYVYTIQANDRDGLAEHLQKNEVSTNIYYPVPIHLQPAITGLYEPPNLPVTESLCSRILSLPMYPALRDEQIEFVADKVKEYVGG